MGRANCRGDCNRSRGRRMSSTIFESATDVRMVLAPFLKPRACVFLSTGGLVLETIGVSSVIMYVAAK
jgi:hypothetical protein